MSEERRKVAYIDGDVVFEATFTPEAAALPAVKFAYRPIPAVRMERYQAPMSDPRKVFATSRKIITKQVVEWDVVKANGDPVSHTDEREIDKLAYQIVLGVAETIIDAVDEAEEEEKN